MQSRVNRRFELHASNDRTERQPPRRDNAVTFDCQSAPPKPATFGLQSGAAVRSSDPARPRPDQIPFHAQRVRQPVMTSHTTKAPTTPQRMPLPCALKASSDNPSPSAKRREVFVSI